jgi:hypothetical protein
MDNLTPPPVKDEEMNPPVIPTAITVPEPLVATEQNGAATRTEQGVLPLSEVAHVEFAPTHQSSLQKIGQSYSLLLGSTLEKHWLSPVCLSHRIGSGAFLCWRLLS